MKKRQKPEQNKLNKPNNQTSIAHKKTETKLFELCIFGLFVLWMVGSAIVGTVNQYTHLPVWDVWDGAVNFFLKTMQGDWQVWWAQHNEHRIVVGKFFFWLDLKLFGGVGISLFVVTYLAVGVLAFFFVKLLIQINTINQNHVWLKGQIKKGEIALALFMFGSFFQFSQNENLTMWFQSGFVLSVLLPVAAFYSFYLFLTNLRLGYFCLSIVFALLASINMANGLVVIPLLIGAFLLSWRNVEASVQKKLGFVVVLLIAAVTMSYLFFAGYKSNQSLVGILLEHFVWVVQYLTYYFGNLFHHLALGFGWTLESATAIAGIFGVLFFLISLGLMGAFLYQKTIKNRHLIVPGYLELCLFLLLSFFWVSALATATGRYGPTPEALNQAFASRYVWYCIAAWSAVIVWLSPLILKVFDRFFVSMIVVMLLMVGSLVPFQKLAFSKPHDFLFYRDVAGLALELGVKDKQVVQSVYPAPEHIFAIAQQAAQHNLSVFGQYPWVDLAGRLGRVENVEQKNDSCLFKLENLSGVAEDNQFVRAHGWVLDPKNEPVPDLVTFFNNKNQVIGFALTGLTRQGATAAELVSLHAGFMGYLVTQFVSQIDYVIATRDRLPLCKYHF